MASCSFSPGRMPTVRVGICGAIAAGQIRWILDRRQLWDKNLAAPHPLKVLEHKIDALLQSNPKPRHARIGHRQDGPSLFRSTRWNSGTTEPREPTTLPYRTTPNRIGSVPTRLFAATKSLSEQSLVAP